jgi:hypothetical protein
LDDRGPQVADRRWLLLRNITSGLSITEAPALEQEELPALAAFPWKHSEFWIDTLLQEAVAGHTSQLNFFTLWARLLSLAHSPSPN